MAGRKQPQPPTTTFKLLLLGDSAVGKSSLLLRFADDSFSFSFLPTIGVDFRPRTIDIDGEPVKLSVWDTAGQERFRTITSAYYRGSHGIVLVYDITSRPSFDSIRGWIRNIDEHTHTSDDACKLLVGNKADMEDKRAVSKEEGRALADEFGIGFYETSAKGDVNVEEAFARIARDAKRRHEQRHPRLSSLRSSGEDQSSSRRRLNINDPTLVPVAPSSCCA